MFSAVSKSSTILQQVSRSFSTQARKKRPSGPKIDGMKRFYKSVGIAEDPEDKMYAILLDGKVIKTPLRNPLKVPSKTLAMAIAHEWDAQHINGIRPASMPLMSLAATCIDDLDVVEDVSADMMKYLGADTVCYYAPSDQSKLLKKQRKLWDPIHKWFESEFGHPLDINNGSIARLRHPDEVISSVHNRLSALDVWTLMPLRTITRECKSLAIALALDERQICVTQAIEAARSEEESQIEEWGLVEGGHDVDRANCNVNVSSASIFLWLLKEQQSAVATA